MKGLRGFNWNRRKKENIFKKVNTALKDTVSPVTVDATTDAAGIAPATDIDTSTNKPSEEDSLEEFGESMKTAKTTHHVNLHIEEKNEVPIKPKFRFPPKRRINDIKRMREKVVADENKKLAILKEKLQQLKYRKPEDINLHGIENLEIKKVEQNKLADVVTIETNTEDGTLPIENMFTAHSQDKHNVDLISKKEEVFVPSHENIESKMENNSEENEIPSSIEELYINPLPDPKKTKVYSSEEHVEAKFEPKESDDDTEYDSADSNSAKKQSMTDYENTVYESELKPLEEEEEGREDEDVEEKEEAESVEEQEEEEEVEEEKEEAEEVEGEEEEEGEEEKEKEEVEEEIEKEEEVEVEGKEIEEQEIQEETEEGEEDIFPKETQEVQKSSAIEAETKFIEPNFSDETGEDEKSSEYEYVYEYEEEDTPESVQDIVTPPPMEVTTSIDVTTGTLSTEHLGRFLYPKFRESHISKC